MLYGRNFLTGDFGQKKNLSLHITQNDIDVIKTLKAKKEESSYYDHMLVWSLHDNPQMKDKDTVGRLAVVMQFVSMLGDVDKRLFQMNNLKPYHISLLRQLYIDYDETEEGPVVSMGYKRPFGNSHVLGDVREEMNRFSTDPILDDDENDNYDEENKVLEQFTNFLVDFFQTFEMRFNRFVYNNMWNSKKTDVVSWDKYIDYMEHQYLRDWTLDKSYLRDEKIDTILN